MKAGNWILFLAIMGLSGGNGLFAEPTAEKIRSNEEKIRAIGADFGSRSATARLSFLCIGRFGDKNQKEMLASLAVQTLEELESLTAAQQEMQKQMEDDPGRDWEQKYGQTGLWSACSQSIRLGEYLKAQCLFWSALCDEREKTNRLSQIIALCENQTWQWQGQEQILQTLALWQRGRPGDSETLRVILHQMMARSDLTEQAMEQMLLLQKRFGLFSQEPFSKELAKMFEWKVAAKTDFEWALEYAFLELGAGQKEPLERVQKTWPQGREFIQSLLREQAGDYFKEHDQLSLRQQMQTFASQIQQQKDPNQREIFEQQWRGWIQSLDPNIPGMDQIRIEAAAEYVQYLYSRPDRVNAEKIVHFLKAEVGRGDTGLGYLYVQALSLLERYGQAVAALAKIPFECRNGAFDLFVLESFADQMEEHIFKEDIPIAPAAQQRAKQLRACFPSEGRDRDRVDLLWAELALHAAEVDASVGQEVDAILSRFEQSTRAQVYRCRALRLMQKKQWTQAAQQWQTIRGTYEPKDRTSKTRSGYWWRAKYYELYCYWKQSDASREDVTHAVKILGSLYDPPPTVWAEKLKTLTK